MREKSSYSSCSVIVIILFEATLRYLLHESSAKSINRPNSLAVREQLKEIQNLQRKEEMTIGGFKRHVISAVGTTGRNYSNY